MHATSRSIVPAPDADAPASLETELDVAMRELRHVLHAARGATTPGALPPGLAASITKTFDEVLDAFARTVDRADATTTATVVARARDELLPFVHLADNAYRWCAKPFGYAGDYLSIANIYANEPSGVGPFGALLDRCFLQTAPAHAVRNRRRLLLRELRATVEAVPDRPARVTSLASGPAAELFDAYMAVEDRSALRSTLVDFDPRAIAYCAERRRLLELDDEMTLVKANIIHLATGKRRVELAEQDLVYSVGLIDYFSDELVVKLLDFVHGVLRPGGRVILGNFHPRNPLKATMDHIFDWKLIHRTDEDMHALFRASAFGTGCSRILYEPQRINLFAEGVKE